MATARLHHSIGSATRPMSGCSHPERHEFRPDVWLLWCVSPGWGICCNIMGYVQTLSCGKSKWLITSKGFLRSLSIHLQICWQVVPGRKFFWCSLLAGWGLPVLFASIALARTGVSYRFGDTCHINHDKALEDYWGPLLAFAAVSTILQFATLGYCIRVYIRSLFKDDPTSQNSSGLPSYNGSVRTVTARQAYRRVQKAVAIQWRGIVVVIIIIVNVVFLAVVFVSMDNTVQSVMQNFGKAEPWLSCLVINGGDKNACLSKVHGLTTPEPTVMAVLILMSVRNSSFGGVIPN